MIEVFNAVLPFLNPSDVLTLLLTIKGLSVTHLVMPYDKVTLCNIPSTITSLNCNKTHDVISIMRSLTLPLHNLRRLDVTGSNITSDCLLSLTHLTWLRVKSCDNIKSICGSDNTSLTYLDCSTCMNMSYESLSKLTNLRILISYANRWLKTLPIHAFKHLTHLDVAGCKNLSNDELIGLARTPITFLDCSFNKRVTDLNSLVTLRSLKCSNCPNLSMKGIGNLTQLYYIDVINDQWATNFSKFTQLVTLDCWFCSNIMLPSTMHIKNVNYTYPMTLW